MPPARFATAAAGRWAGPAGAVAGAGGRVVAQQAETAARGRWTTSFRSPRKRRQTGTLEAVAESAKDGTLVCIVQVRVRLGAR